MIGAFDVVHVRLLILVVQKTDPANILRNLLRMLKPGGYLQWDDLNYPDTHVKASDSSMQTPALNELRKVVYSQGRNDLTLRLSNFFAEEGLLGVRLYHYQNPLDMAKANGEQQLLTMEKFASS